MPVLAGCIDFNRRKWVLCSKGLSLIYCWGSGQHLEISPGGAVKGELPAAVSLGALVGGFCRWSCSSTAKLLAGLPRSLMVSVQSFLPLLALVWQWFLMFLINIPLAAINTGLNNFLQACQVAHCPSWLLVGGMMAVDMVDQLTKPLMRKFATGTLCWIWAASGGSIVMAAVMAAGMVPPLAVFSNWSCSKINSHKKNVFRFDKHRYGSFLLHRRCHSIRCSWPSPRHP